MRLMIALTAAAVVFASAPAALAETTSPAPAASEAAAKPPKPKRICRQGPASSTGRVGTGKVCKTADEWAEIDAGGGLRSSSSRAVTTGTADTQN